MKPKQLQPSRGHLHCLVSVFLHTQTSLISQDFIKETSLLILLLLLWSSVNLCTCSMNTVSKTILTVLIVLALSDQDAHDSVNRAHRRPKDRMLKKRSNCLFQNVTALVSTVQTNSCPIQPCVVCSSTRCETAYLTESRTCLSTECSCTWFGSAVPSSTVQVFELQKGSILSVSWWKTSTFKCWVRHF